jgi:hypothetical protein
VILFDNFQSHYSGFRSGRNGVFANFIKRAFIGISALSGYKRRELPAVFGAVTYWHFDSRSSSLL